MKKVIGEIAVLFLYVSFLSSFIFYILARIIMMTKYLYYIYGLVFFF